MIARRCTVAHHLDLYKNCQKTFQDAKPVTDLQSSLCDHHPGLLAEQAVLFNH